MDSSSRVGRPLNTAASRGRLVFLCAAIVFGGCLWWRPQSTSDSPHQENQTSQTAGGHAISFSPVLALGGIGGNGIALIALLGSWRALRNRDRALNATIEGVEEAAKYRPDFVKQTVKASAENHKIEHWLHKRVKKITDAQTARRRSC